MDRSLQILDWPFIQKALAERTLSPLGHAAAVCHNPFAGPNALHLAERLREMTSELMTLQRSKGAPALQQGIADTVNCIDHFERAARGALVAADALWHSGHFMRAVGETGEAIRNSPLAIPTLRHQWNLAPPTPPLCNEILRSVTQTGEVLDSASTRLFQLRSTKLVQKREFEQRLESCVAQWHSQGLLQDKFYDQVEGRYVVPVKSGSQHQVLGSLVGHSNTGQSVYIEPQELLGPSNALKQIDLDILEEIRRILTELSAKLGALSSSFKHWIEPVADLDLAAASATLSQDWQWNRGKTRRPDEDSSLIFRGLRHPELGLNAISNHVEFKQGLLISGPNTGGKTVLIKAMALAVHLHRAGLYIPAELGSVIPDYGQVYAVIGDDQDLQGGLSSYSAQLLELKGILDTPHTGPVLVVVDEILASTNADEGSALAQAILEDFTSKGHHVVVTSHFSNLALYCRENPSFAVAAMEFSDGRPTYRLRPDEIGSSHALEVAASLGLSSSLLERARSLLSTERLDYQEAAASLRKKEKELEHTHAAALAELDRARLSTEHELKQELFTFQTQLEKSIAQQIADLEKRETVIRKIRSAVEEHRSRNANAPQAHPSPANKKSLPHPVTPLVLKAGRRVRVKSLNRAEGKVISVDEREKLAVIQVGNFRTTKPWSDLEGGLTPSDSRPTRSSFIPTSIETIDIPGTLDLRGKRRDEALSAAEQVVDRAFRAGRPYITIITGHGTGTLKTSVRALLQSLPYVKGIQAAHESDDGALVVELEQP